MDDNLGISKEEEDEILLELAEKSGFRKIPYRPIFYNPDGKIAPGLSDDYYEAARAITKRVLTGQTLGDTEGIAALFLFRHYLELTLKGVAYNLRWLISETENVPRTENVKWPEGHRLDILWQEIKGEFPKKMGRKLWHDFDTEFLEKCVSEFHSIDPFGERFRYRREKRSPRRDRLKTLIPSWPDLLMMMAHAHNVLGAMETYLMETYGQNEEWQDEMRSW